MRITLGSLVLLLVACFAEPLGPVDITFGADTCAFCRMVISDKRFPAQIVSPGQVPLFFDDIECMAKHLSANGVPRNAAVFVTDYKNSRWIRAADASYFRCPGLASPMNSGLIASAKGGTPTFCPSVEAKQLFGKELP